MALEPLQIDWYADGFEARIEAAALLGPLPILVAVGGGFISFIGCIGAVNPPSPEVGPWLTGMLVFGLIAMFGGGFVSGTLADRAPVTVIEVTPHVLRVRRGNDRIELETPLDGVRSVSLVGYGIRIRSEAGDVHVNAGSQTRQSVENVVVALQAAVDARTTTEGPADRERRERALAQLAAMRRRHQ